jgi:4-amino-4-deoxy-L-arabinose transferase-like glycosyltransferase
VSFGLGAYIGGVAMLAFVLGSAFAAAYLITRRALPELAGPPRWLALATVTTAAVIAVHLVPGALGVLTRGTVIASAAVLLAVSVGLCRHGSWVEGDPDPIPDAPDTSISRLLAAVALGAVAVGALAVVVKIAGLPPAGVDATNFQIPTVGRWLQNDTVWGLHQFLPGYSNATYPQHGNLLMLALVMPFDRPFLAPLSALPFYPLGMLAVYALGRELRVPAGTAVLGAAVAAAIPVATVVSVRSAVTDMPCTALLIIGTLFLLRQHRTGARSDLVLAGLALGLSAGIKWYGVWYAVAAGAVWATGQLLARERWRRVAVQAGLLTAVALLAGGFWLVRNWVETGNPVFPVKVAIGGLTLFDAAPDHVREQGGFTLVHYATDLDVWRHYLWPIFRGDFNWPALVASVGLLGALGLAAWRRRLEAVAVGVLTLLLLGLYAVTPYSAFGPENMPILAGSSTRYALPALFIAAALTGWAVVRTGRARTVLEAALVLAVLLGLRSAYEDLGATDLVKGAGVVAVAAAGAVLAVRLTPVGRSALAAAVLVVTLAAGDHLRDRYEDGSYAGYDPVYGALERAAPDDRSVAFVGLFPIREISYTLPAMGPTLGNDVSYLGEFRDDYLRAFETEAPMVDALQRGGYDFVLVGRGQQPAGPVESEQWVRRAGYRPVAASPDLALFART